MWCMYDVLSRYSKTNDIIFPLFGLATGQSEMEDWPTKNMNSWAKGRFFLQKMICFSANQSLFFFTNNCYMSANFLTNELVLSVHSDWSTVLFVVTPVWFSVDGNQVILSNISRSSKSLYYFQYFGYIGYIGLRHIFKIFYANWSQQGPGYQKLWGFLLGWKCMFHKQIFPPKKAF